MKIDFHCHTKATKLGESSERNVTEELFQKKVTESGVKIIVISNHNHFDLDQFNKLQVSVQGEAILWPGVELDVIGESNVESHIVVVCNPLNKNLFKDALDKLIGEETEDDFKGNLIDIINAFDDLDVIYSPHHQKSRSMPMDDIEFIKNSISNERRLLYEPSSLFGVGVLNSHGYNGILGSDGHSWQEYEKAKLGRLKFEVSSYENFCKALDKNFQVLNDLRHEFFNKEIRVYGESSTKRYEYDIPIYNDINIIYGDKGSGKSEILASLNDYFITSESIKPVYYKSGESDKWFNELLKVDWTTDQADFDISDLSLNFKQIEEFIDETPTPISTYYKYFSETIINRKIKKMNCTKIDKINQFNENKYTLLKKELKIITDFKNNLESLSLYTIESDLTLFNELDRFEKKYKIALLEEFINQKSNYLFDDFIENIADLVSQNTGHPSKPTTVGFSAFAKNRIYLQSNIQKINRELDKKKSVTNLELGSIGNKGMGLLETEILYLNLSNKTLIHYTQLKGNKKPLEEILQLLQDTSYFLDEMKLSKNISEFKEILKNDNITGLSSFVAIKKRFYIKGQSVNYNPSKGEKAILNLQHNLISKINESVFLIDEPELSLGSKYLEDNILPILNTLASQRKIVVIATHNANLAVRTRPISSIYKKVDNNKYSTYVGSIFTDVLINIDDESDSESWMETSLNHLEGGHSAFDERSNLYDR